jgi:hypothetical protein
MTDTFNKTTIAFEFDHKEGERVSLLIGTPICVDDGEWRCPYKFVGFSNTKTRWISGVDATQSLELAIRVATGMFSQLDEVQDGRVTWLGSNSLILSKGSET